jgi:hypothetical protein
MAERLAYPVVELVAAGRRLDPRQQADELVDRVGAKRRGGSDIDS